MSRDPSFSHGVRVLFVTWGVALCGDLRAYVASAPLAPGSGDGVVCVPRDPTGRRALQEQDERSTRQRPSSAENQIHDFPIFSENQTQLRRVRNRVPGVVRFWRAQVVHFS